MTQIEKSRKQKRQAFYKKKIRMYFLDKKTNTIYVPKGAFSSILKENKAHKISITYKASFTPWKEQSYVVEEIKKTNTGLIEMKTAKGKSKTAAMIINYHQTKTLIVLHSLAVVKEMVDTIEEVYGIRPKQIRSGVNKKDFGMSEITITTHNSFRDKTEMFNEFGFGLVIIDECDYNLSPKMAKALSLIDCHAIYGMTGTPEREDIGIEGMKKVFGEKIKLEEQENNGYHFVPEIFMCYYEVPKELKEREDRHTFLELLMNNLERENKQIEIIRKVMEKGKITHALILCGRKEDESRRIYDRLQMEMIPKLFLGVSDGMSKEKEDEETIKEFNNSEKGLLIGTAQKIGRGKDIPIVNGIFLFSRIKASATTIQEIGRGLRISPDGKKECFIFDRVDMPALKGQAYKRMQVYTKEYPGVSIKKTTI